MSTVYRNPEQNPSGGGSSLVVVALVSIVSALVTNGVIMHFGLWPTEAKASPSKLIVPLKLAPAKAKGPSATDAQVQTGADAMQQASDAATAVLSVLDTIQTTAPGFVGIGPGQHSSLNRNFMALTNAANALQQNSSTNPATKQKVITAFTTILGATISLAKEISTRDSETDTSKEMAAQVAAALEQIKDSLP